MKKKKIRKPRDLKIAEVNLVARLYNYAIDLDPIAWGTSINPMYADEARKLAEWLVKAAEYLESKK